MSSALAGQHYPILHLMLTMRDTVWVELCMAEHV